MLLSVLVEFVCVGLCEFEVVCFDVEMKILFDLRMFFVLMRSDEKVVVLLYMFCEVILKW